MTGVMDVEPKRNKDKEALVIAAVNGSPFYKHINMRLVEFTDEGSVMEMPFIAEHLNVWGSMHGGAISSLIDSSCGTAVGPFLADNETVVTLDLRVQFLKPIREGTLTAHGRMVHRSGRFAITECDVYGRENELVARGSTIHTVIRRKGGD